MNATAAPIRKSAFVVKPRKSAEVPATTSVVAGPADSIEKIRAEVKVLTERLQKVSVVTVKEAPVRTADLDNKTAGKLHKMIDRLAVLRDHRREIESEEKAIKADLETFLEKNGASSIESPHGRYCAEPSKAFISVHGAIVKHQARF